MRKFPFFLLFVALCAWAWASAPDWEQEAAKRKAEYIYLESLNAYAQEDYDKYVMLTKRAYELDSTDLDIAAEWNMLNLIVGTLDSIGSERAYDKLHERFFNQEPNFTSGTMLASLAKRMGKYNDLTKIWERLDTAFPSLNQPQAELANAYIISYVLGDSLAYDKAMEIYKRMEAGNGKTIDISSQKIRAFSIKKDTAAIVSELEELLDNAPGDSYIALFAGSNYQYLQYNDKAKEMFQKACQLDSTNGMAYLAIANLYNQLGDSVAFDREVFMALKSQNLEIDSKLEILRSYVSELYSDSTQENRIRQLFNELEQMHSSEPEIHNLYAAYLYEIKDYKGSTEEMTYSVALDPSNENSWMTLAQMASLSNDTLAMVKYGSEGMEKFPDNLYFPICTADGHRLLGEYDEAIAVLDSVKMGSNPNPTGWSTLIAFKGDIYSMAGDTLSALKAYDEAIELNPENYLALNNAAYYMAENDIDLDKAEQYAAKVVRNVPDNPTYLDTYAWIFFKKQEYSLARQYIDMTLNLYADTVALKNEEAMVGDNPVDEAMVEEVIEVENAEPETPTADVLEHAGDIYFWNREPERALDFWKQALALDPENERLKKKVKNKTYHFK